MKDIKFFGSNGSAFLLLSVIIAIVIAKFINDAEQIVLGDFFQTIGSGLATIAAYDAYIARVENSANNPTNNNLINTTTVTVVDEKPFVHKLYDIN